MARRGSSVQVGQALEGLLKGLESGPRVRESLALAYWEEAAGPQNAAATEAEAVRDGVLFVRTKSAVWSHELSFLKEHLIRRLNELIGRAVIKDIKFRGGGLRRKKGATEGGDPTPADLEAVVLPPDEQASLLDELSLVTNIPDVRLRQAVERRITRDRKLRRWRLEHGWKACRACSTPHDTAGDLCPVCRLCR